MYIFVPILVLGVWSYCWNVRQGYAMSFLGGKGNFDVSDCCAKLIVHVRMRTVVVLVFAGSILQVNWVFFFLHCALRS